MGDRAVELYAYIKGGTVDYGEVHAAKFNHSRRGRTFPGIYPEWGTPGPDGSLRRVHLVGHSMGGTTIRVLLRLLADGDPYERLKVGASTFFNGGRGSWVHSISTVNAPHDGTTLVDGAMGSFVDVVAWPFFKGICAAGGLVKGAIPYDFKLDQFGLERRRNEDFVAYANRVKASPIWDEEFRDFSSYDLGLAGSREMNAITPALPNVYYFAYASVDTRKTINPFSKHQVPRWMTMWAFLQPFSTLMGRSGDMKWWPNDGVVNTISQNGPKLSSQDVIVHRESDNETVRPGVWNYMGATNGLDHVEIIGIGIQPVMPLYRALAANIAALPQKVNRSLSEPALLII